MPPQLAQLEQVLASLTEAHRELCCVLEQQQDAMKRFDMLAMADAVRLQEQFHRRIMKLEAQRRRLVESLHRPGSPRRGPDEPKSPAPTLAELAEQYPGRSDELLRLRAELRSVTQDAAGRTHVCGRVAGTVLAHLNHALRLVNDATCYQQSGSFSPPPSRNRLEAVA